MKILVTGGAGFIGSNFIYLLLEKEPESEIVCLDALTYAGNMNTLKKAQENPHFRFIYGDIADDVVIERLFDQEHFDVVVNFAAESHVDRSIVDPTIFVKTNVLGTQILLNACWKRQIRFHQVSTDEVYGELPLDRPDLSFDENFVIRPSSPYSASKAGADHLCLAYFRTFHTPVTISRCSNNYGPYQFPEKLIPLMILRAQANESLPVYGDGKNVRDWLHVRDHCEAIYLILKKGTLGEVYNIGGNNEHSNLNMVKMILKQLNKSESLIQFVEDRLGHDLRYAINAQKIRKELGWVPKVEFEQGIKETISWYLDHASWCQSILTQAYFKENERYRLESLQK